MLWQISPSVARPASESLSRPGRSLLQCPYFDHTGPRLPQEAAKASDWVSWCTQRGEHPMRGERGDFYWQGTWGTRFFVDQKKQLVAVLMLQTSSSRAP